MHPDSPSLPNDERAAFTPIGRVEATHRDARNTPSQASEAGAPARVIVDERFMDGLLGLERYEYVWLLTWLDRQPEERPLRLVPRVTEATGEVQGVFASRAPTRPNGIGMSLVRTLGIDRNVISVHGVDLLDRTPVLDIKPWFADCDLPESVRGDVRRNQ